MQGQNVKRHSCNLDLLDFLESGLPLRPLLVPHVILARFMQLADQNTRKNLETCGVLAGKLRHDEFTVTHLIVPKQTATSDTCGMINEEEIFECQDRLDLLTLGWIHVKFIEDCKIFSSISSNRHIQVSSASLARSIFTRTFLINC